MVEGYIETTQKAEDPSNVVWMGKSGDSRDLPPVGKPPVIQGFATDNQRLRVKMKDGTVKDIQPSVLGLSALAVVNLAQDVYPSATPPNIATD